MQSLRLITPNGETIRVVPKGRQVTGGTGRVDLECPPKKSILIQTDPGQWRYARLSPESGGWVTQDLTEESFWKALADVIS